MIDPWKAKDFIWKLTYTPSCSFTVYQTPFTILLQLQFFSITLAEKVAPFYSEVEFSIKIYNLRITWENKEKVIKSFSSIRIFHHKHDNQTKLKWTTIKTLILCSVMIYLLGMKRRTTVLWEQMQ